MSDVLAAATFAVHPLLSQGAPERRVPPRLLGARVVATRRISQRRRAAILGWACTVFCLIVLGSAGARAQSVAASTAYDAALERALSAHALRDYAQAEAAMREAHALAPSARTYRGLGVILYASERYAEAVEAFEAALHSQQRPLDAALRASVEELLGRIRQRAGRLHMTVVPGDSEVSVDGAVPVAHGSAGILLPPGEHRVRVSAPGYEPYELSVRAQAGSRDSLHVVLARPETEAVAGGGSPGAVAVAGDREPSERHAKRWNRRLRNGLLASGAVLVVAGASSWFTGYVRFRKLASHCEESPEGACSESEAKQRFEDQNIQPLTVGGAVLLSTGAAALLVTAGVELWLRPAKRVQIALSPRGVAASYHF